MASYYRPGCENGIRPFFTFQWHLTDLCDQRCRHCYIYAGDPGRTPVSASRELMDHVLEKTVSFAEKLGCLPHFCLTGGDPLLHDGFFPLAEELHRRRIPFDILGNPFHLTDRVCRKLKKLGCARYQMSLDGLEETHDFFRKPGSYRETLHKIPMINRSGMTSVIMTTVSGRNIHEIPALIDVCVSAGTGLYAFARYCPTPGEHVGITPEEYRDFLRLCGQKFRKLQQSGCKTAFAKKDHLWAVYDYERGALSVPGDAGPDMIYDGCHCGQNHLTILPDGQVMACRRAAGSVVGRLPEDDLLQIWLERMEGYRDVRRFKKCFSCPLVSFCRGCPAVAMGETGDFYAPDPQCWFDPEKISTRRHGAPE